MTATADWQRAKRRKRMLTAAVGYLALEMPEHALGELQPWDDDPDVRFTVSRLQGEAFQQLGDPQLALDAFTNAHRERKNDPGVLMGIAWCYKCRGRMSQAIAALKRAQKLAPDKPVVLFNLSCYYALVGDKPRALSCLGRALRMERSLRSRLAEESDFDELRDDPGFQFITGQIESIGRAQH